jgi:hypothetical protein
MARRTRHFFRRLSVIEPAPAVAEKPRRPSKRDRPPLDPDKANLRQAFARLTPKKARFVSNILAGMKGAPAIQNAGWRAGSEYARTKAAQLLNHDENVMLAVAVARRELAQRAEYGADEAMKELNAAAEFSRKTENSMALAKIIELKMRLTGQYVEKHDIRQLAMLQISIEGLND